MVRCCKVCGAVYDTCYSCQQTKSWRTMADTADHYYLLLTLMAYQVDGDAEKAYAALTKRGIDLAHTEGYLPNIRDLLAEIDLAVYDAAQDAAEG